MESRFLQNFHDLASWDQNLRNRATFGIVRGLESKRKMTTLNQGTNSTSNAAGSESATKTVSVTLSENGTSTSLENIDYTLKRLIRGLGSSRDSARQGFCTTLIEVIRREAEPDLCIWSKVLKFGREQLLNDSASMSLGSTDKDVLFGRLFLNVAIVESGALDEKEVERYFKSLPKSSSSTKKQSKTSASSIQTAESADLDLSTPSKRRIAFTKEILCDLRSISNSKVFMREPVARLVLNMLKTYFCCTGESDESKSTSQTQLVEELVTVFLTGKMTNDNAAIKTSGKSKTSAVETLEVEKISNIHDYGLIFGLQNSKLAFTTIDCFSQGKRLNHLLHQLSEHLKPSYETYHDYTPWFLTDMFNLMLRGSKSVEEAEVVGNLVVKAMSKALQTVNINQDGEKPKDSDKSNNNNKSNNFGSKKMSSDHATLKTLKIAELFIETMKSDKYGCAILPAFFESQFVRTLCWCLGNHTSKHFKTANAFLPILQKCLALNVSSSSSHSNATNFQSDSDKFFLQAYLNLTNTNSSSAVPEAHRLPTKTLRTMSQCLLNRISVESIISNSSTASNNSQSVTVAQKSFESGSADALLGLTLHPQAGSRTDILLPVLSQFLYNMIKENETVLMKKIKSNNNSGANQNQIQNVAQVLDKIQSSLKSQLKKNNKGDKGSSESKTDSKNVSLKIRDTVHSTSSANSGDKQFWSNQFWKLLGQLLAKNSTNTIYSNANSSSTSTSNSNSIGFECIQFLYSILSELGLVTLSDANEENPTDGAVSSRVKEILEVYKHMEKHGSEGSIPLPDKKLKALLQLILALECSRILEPSSSSLSSTTSTPSTLTSTGTDAPSDFRLEKIASLLEFIDIIEEDGEEETQTKETKDTPHSPPQTVFLHAKIGRLCEELPLLYAASSKFLKDSVAICWRELVKELLISENKKANGSKNDHNDGISDEDEDEDEEEEKLDPSLFDNDVKFTSTEVVAKSKTYQLFLGLCGSLFPERENAKNALPIDLEEEEGEGSEEMEEQVKGKDNDSDDKEEDDDDATTPTTAPTESNGNGSTKNSFQDIMLTDKSDIFKVLTEDNVNQEMKELGSSFGVQNQKGLENADNINKPTNMDDKTSKQDLEKITQVTILTKQIKYLDLIQIFLEECNKIILIDQKNPISNSSTSGSTSSSATSTLQNFVLDVLAQLFDALVVACKLLSAETPNAKGQVVVLKREYATKLADVLGSLKKNLFSSSTNGTLKSKESQSESLSESKKSKKSKKQSNSNEESESSNTNINTLVKINEFATYIHQTCSKQKRKLPLLFTAGSSLIYHSLGRESDSENKSETSDKVKSNLNKEIDCLKSLVVTTLESWISGTSNSNDSKWCNSFLQFLVEKTEIAPQIFSNLNYLEILNKGIESEKNQIQKKLYIIREIIDFIVVVGQRHKEKVTLPLSSLIQLSIKCATNQDQKNKNVTQGFLIAALKLTERIKSQVANSNSKKDSILDSLRQSESTLKTEIKQDGSKSAKLSCQLRATIENLIKSCSESLSTESNVVTESSPNTSTKKSSSSKKRSKEEKHEKDDTATEPPTKKKKKSKKEE